MAAKQPTLAQRLARLREGAGLTRTQLARKANVSRQYLRDLELGNKGRPSLAVAARLAAALECDLAELVGANKGETK